MNAAKESKRYRITEEEDGFWVSIFTSRNYPLPFESFGPFESYAGALQFTSEWEHVRPGRKGEIDVEDNGGLTINVDLN